MSTATMFLTCQKEPAFPGQSTKRMTNSQGLALMPGSFKNCPSCSSSFNNPMVNLKPLEPLDRLFKECRRVGEIFVSEGLITQQDNDDAKTQKWSTVISVGLPAYCLLQSLLRPAKANCSGLLLSDNTEISSSNRPKDAFFDWLLNTFLIMKEQIKAANLSEAKEEYFSKLVLLNSDPVRLKNSNIGLPPESELRRAELDGVARRTWSEDLAKKNGNGRSNRGPQTIVRSKSAFAQVFSQKSFKWRSGNNGSDQESELVHERKMEIV